MTLAGDIRIAEKCIRLVENVHNDRKYAPMVKRYLEVALRFMDPYNLNLNKTVGRRTNTNEETTRA